MKLLIKDKGSGKTTGLIYTSESTDYPIVVSDNISKHYIIDMAKQIGCEIPEPLTVEDLRRANIYRGQNILFDNVESILERAINSYLDANVVCATMTNLLKEKNDDNKTEELTEKVEELVD